MVNSGVLDNGEGGTFVKSEKKRETEQAYYKNKIFIPLIIILTVISLSLGITLSLGDDGSQNNYRVVKELVYSGNDTSENSINQIKKCMDQANSKNLVPGVKFVYDTSKVINNQTLSGYDVLIMAGSETGF